MTDADRQPQESDVRSALERRRADSPAADLWALLDQVHDPEIPVISIWEMGILRDVQRSGDGVEVVLTPTYSGCPAMDHIREEIVTLMRGAGVAAVRVRTELAPAWGSDCLSQVGMEKMRAWGIAPPGDGAPGESGLTPERGVRCPRCGSRETRVVSEFGSTSCKALFRCGGCGEPFDYFKRF